MPIICTWSITVMDIHDKPTTLEFDLKGGDAPLIMGLDVLEHANILSNTSRPPTIVIQRSSDKAPRTFYTYFTSKDPFDKRQHIAIVPSITNSALVTMSVSKLIPKERRKAWSLAKKMHCFSHSHKDDILHICNASKQTNKPEVQQYARSCI